MQLTDAQLSAIVAHAMPGARLREAAAMGERTLALTMGDRRAVLRLSGPADPWAGDPLAAEAAALAALRGEIDLPLPELLAHDDGAAAGTPYLLCSTLEGIPLPDAIGELSEEQRYAVGRELGALLARVHSYTTPIYGALSPASPPRPPSGDDGEEGFGDADVRYLAARLDAAIADALAAGDLDEAGAARLRDWGAGNLAGTGRPAALTHGDLRPERVLLRRRERAWRVGGLTSWGFALAWRPAWDHVAIMEHFAGPSYFGLRVGYGNAYDEHTERRYDQLREFALLPYRLTLFLEAGRADLALGLVGTQPIADSR